MEGPDTERHLAWQIVNKAEEIEPLRLRQALCLVGAIEKALKEAKEERDGGE